MIEIFNRKHLRWEGDTAIDYFELFVGSKDDLPAVDAFSNSSGKYRIAMGSLAMDVSTGDIYQMQANETWKKRG